MEKNFGWLRKADTYRTENILIQPLPTHDDAIKNVLESYKASKADFQSSTLGWIYPGIVRRNSEVNVPTLRFQLPTTHKITCIDPHIKEEGLDFLILVLGFCLGLKLLPEGWGHFYKTPESEAKLVRFYANHKEIEFILGKALCLWLGDNEQGQKLIGIIHWFLSSQSYEHDFEVFNWQYTVLDSIYELSKDNIQKIFGKRRIGHYERAAALCELYNIKCPEWASKKEAEQKNFCDLSEIRNALIHEAKWEGEPIGFAARANDEVFHGIKDLNSCLILAILGIRSSLFKSYTPWNRMTHCLDISNDYLHIPNLDRK